jgi:GNAT superfamily N-acetyltransferase
MSTPGAKFAMKIRCAEPRDAARLAELAGQLGYPATAEEIARRIEETQHSSESCVFVAELAAGEIAGWIGVFVFRSIVDEPRVELSGLVVDENVRSRGIGEKLLDRAEEWAREKGCGEVGLRCNVIRERAHAFYERHGYKSAKTQKSFRKKLKG